MYGGHGRNAVPKAIIDDALELCGEIMAGTDDRMETPIPEGIAIMPSALPEISSVWTAVLPILHMHWTGSERNEKRRSASK